MGRRGGLPQCLLCAVERIYPQDVAHAPYERGQGTGRIHVWPSLAWVGVVGGMYLGVTDVLLLLSVDIIVRPGQTCLTTEGCLLYVELLKLVEFEMPDEQRGFVIAPPPDGSGSLRSATCGRCR